MCDTDTKYTALESEQQQALLKVFEPLLKVRLIPTTMLLHLTEMFTIEEIIDIRNEELQKGRATAVHSLVERLLRKSEDYPDWFRVFMDALRYSDNGHIAEIIEGTCVSSMDELENYKRHIELFAPHLEVINPAEILPELTSILSDHDREQIKADQRNHGPCDAVLTLLDRLVKKTGDWFKDFLQALRSVGRDDLANLLHPQATQGAVYQQQDDLVTNTGGGRSDDNRVESGQQSLSPDRPPAQAVDSGQRAIQDGDVPSESPTTVPDESKVSPRGEACVNGSADYSDNGEPTAIPLESAEQLFESKPAAAVENVDVPVQSEKVTPVSNLDEGDTTHEEFNVGQGTTELLNTDVIEEKSDREYKEKPSQQSEGAIGEDKIDNDQLKARAINLRAYQTELVEPAFNGKNVILFAPTGSGKTVMAVAVMQYHLQEHNTGTRKKRVMFLVNQRPLVEQQERVFKHYLEPLGYRIIQLTGETLTYSLNQVVEARYDVIVLTAQILENALEDGDIKSLSVFTMLIFDECHHTQGKTSFNRIMGRYRDMKLERPEEPRPQIIGLTASIGVGKAANESGARDHILQICANLDVEMISKVVEYKNELSKYSPLPHEDILSTPRRQNDSFGNQLNTIMSIIETEMESSKGVKEHKDLLKETEKRPIERGSLLYEQWLVKLCKHAIVLLDDKNVRRFFTTCSDHLREYNNALFIYKDVIAAESLAYLDRYFEKLDTKRQGFDSIDDTLFKLFKDRRKKLELVTRKPPDVNPTLEKLKLVVEDMYEENPDSRTIVITKTRASCYALTRWMEQTGGLSDLKPAFLVGSKSSSDGSKGMAQAEQSDVLDRFQDGTHRIIVCTSVGQEGIDIKKCNLVLRYNYSNNEIGRIQAKGRNRTMGGKTVLLAGHHTRIIKQEEMNIIRELMMYKAIDEIRGMPQDEYVSSIKKMQENDQIDRLQQAEAEKTAKMLREKEGRGVSIKFLCGKCSAFACLATDFRALKTNYVVTNTAFLDRIKTQPHAKPKQIDDLFYKEGKVFCKECMHDWGIMVKRKGSHYPMLKIRSFILERGGSRSIYRNWRDAPFVAEPLDDACLLK